MNILVIGSPDRAKECREKFGETHSWTVCEDVPDAKEKLMGAEVVFDFVSADKPEQLGHYPSTFSAAVFIDTSCARLSKLALNGSIKSDRLFGFCGLPTLLNREVLEVSVLNADAMDTLNSLCSKLATPFEVVADQAGMVTPRVICMIINEAYFTLEEGTATRHDIDLAMKLGTNYPFGPFEWAERIGLPHVVKVLQAASTDSGDVRYAICPLLYVSRAVRRSSFM